ncbi:MAG: DUF5979 domain-containing protein [Leucobacter sp.]
MLVDLPGGGGIDDGIEIPDTWGKSGEMNANNWSMKWKIELPGERMRGNDVINIADSLSANHVLCNPSNLKVETVRGDTVVDVTTIAAITAGADAQNFTIGLTAPESGFDANVTYRITYDTCTEDGQIDPADTEYTNEAVVDVWGEGSGIIGVNPNPWQEGLTKSGSVLGGADRNGKIAWTVTVPGDQLVGKTGFNFAETLGAGHEVGPDTISGIRITERYGPSNQMQGDVTGKLTPTVASSSAHAFDINFAVTDVEFAFKASDFRYIITYSTYVSESDLPAGGTGYTNEVSVDGAVAGTETKVPGRTDTKNGSINTSAITLDGDSHLPQTTLGWNITVPGERLEAVEGNLVVTDTLSGAHEVCAPGDPTGGLASQLGFKLEARDQVQNGGLSTVDLTDSVTVGHEDGVLTFTVPEPSLAQPGGGTETGFSTEYQYIFTYMTCTSSGGMDAPGTTYGNSAEVNGKTYTKTVTQENRGSGSGQGMPRGTVSVEKTLADTPGAAFVPDDATFTVHVQEIDPTGMGQAEYDLQVPLNGDPVSGFNARGTGWTAVLTEPTFPSIPGVTFGDPLFAEGDGVVVSNDGTTATANLTPGSNIALNLTNEAQLGSLTLEKAVTGAAVDLVDDAQTYQVTAHIDTSALGAGFPAQDDRVIDLAVGEPVVLEDLPIGAVVTFSEAVPADDDILTWGAPVFSPESITVTAEHATTPAVVTLTNSVERTVGTFSLTKTVDGEQADNPAVPDTVTVTATWDGAGSPKVLTVPTDGTPVDLGEQLLIGTEVTLTETPLVDGSSIAWGAPTWSGTGVTVDGEDAIVTIGRDAAATVNLTNHAATSVAGISLLKGLAGEAVGEVDPTTEFPVTATWTDAAGDEQSKNITINAVTPTELGEDLPAGTVVTITEGERPAFDTVIWGSIVISGTDVTDNGDGNAEIIVSDQQNDVTLVTVVNEATWAPGTFELSKAVTGVLLENADVPEAVTVTASWIVDGETVSEELTVPTDGTVVPFGMDLPHETEVTLSEALVAGSPAFTWDTPVWAAEGIVAHDDGTATITIGAAQNTAVSLTNNATATLGGLSIMKSLVGDGAADVPADTVYPVVATWTDLLGEEQRVELELTAGTAAELTDLPFGTEVTLTENAADTQSNVKWLGGTWASDAENITVAGDGSEVVVTVVGEADSTVDVTLENEFEKVPDLAITGGGIAIVGLIAGATLLIGGAVLLIVRRKLA